MKYNLNNKRYSFQKFNYSRNSSESNIINLFKVNEENELNEILTSIRVESHNNNSPPFKCVKKLTNYIRRNRNSLDNILTKIIDTIKNISNVNLIINIVNTMINLVYEGRNHHLSEIIDILIKKLDIMPQTNADSIEKIVNLIGDLIKLDNISIQKYIETNINKIINSLTKQTEQKSAKIENAKFYYILLLSKILENCSLFAYNVITKEENFKNFQGIIKNFKDSKTTVRYAVGELIKQFNYILKSRDYESRVKYQNVIFQLILSEFKKHLKENNGDLSNLYLIIGIFMILKNLYYTDPFILIKNEKMYISLVEELNKCLNSRSIFIKTFYIKSLPDLYKMNKEFFTKKYLTKFLNEINKYLNIKSNNEIRKNLLVTLGYLSLDIEPKAFDICKNNLISLLKNLVSEKHIYDDEIFKCLADLLNNKQNLYMEIIITKFDMHSILLKIFKNGLTTYKIEFLTSIMSAWSNFSKQYISTAISSLQAVSLILCDEDFNFEHFYEEIDHLGVRGNFIDKNLENILENVNKYIKKYIVKINSENYNEKNLNNNENIILRESQKKPEYIKCKCLHDLKTIIYALTLFSRIEYSFFLKDMLIFYIEKILPLLSVSSSKIKKKILGLLTYKFIKIFSHDKNHSEFLLNNIIDSVEYLIFNERDVSTQVYAINILQKKEIFLDLILKNKENHCNKFIGFITTDIDKEVKKEIIQTIGSLMKRSKDKNYFSFLVKKCINNFLFEIENSEDIVYKEDFIELIYFKSVYLKNTFDINLIEKILESLISLNINYNYEGNIFIMSLKIAYELISSELINYNFLININYSKNVTKYCYILLILVVNNLKDGGDNTIKTQLSLKILYQIIKILKIDIYNEINPDIIMESFDSLDLFQKNASIKNNDSLKKFNQEYSINNINKYINDSSSQKYFDNNEFTTKLKKNEKINIVDILIQCIIKGQNGDENLNIIMNIFGLSGSMDPLVMEKLFFSREASIYHLEGSSYNKNYFDENSFIVQKYNQKTQITEEINLSNIEPIKYKSILYMIRILKENTQQELIRQIINNLNIIITNLEQKDEKIVEIIFPEIIQILPNLNNSQKNDLFNSIISIIHNYKKVTKENLKELVHLTKNYIGKELYFEKCNDIFKYLFINFVEEMEIYYHELIPIFLSLINSRYNSKSGKEKKYENHIIDLILIMTKNENIYSYLNIIFYKVIPLFLKTDDFNDNFLNFFHKIIKEIIIPSNFFPLLVKALIEKIKIIVKEKNSLIKGKNSEVTLSKEKKPIIERILNIFKEMYMINKENFINFLPTIIKILSNLSIIKCIDYETIIFPMLSEYSIYNEMNVVNYRTKIIITQCFPFCKLGFNNLKFRKKNKIEKKYSDPNSLKLVNSMNYSKQNSKTMKNKKSINRKNSIDDDMIIKVFDTSICLTQKDWNEWFKSTSKILFEQSPSVFIHSSKFLADYYYPLINELYNYSFFDVYKNIDDSKKTFLSSNLTKALENPKTPNEILLAIINLEEFSERKNDEMCFLDDYYLLGKVSLKCKAYAKALYFFEFFYTNNNGFENIEDLLEVYYELKLPESAIGLLLKSSEKNRNKNRRGDDSINMEGRKSERRYSKYKGKRSSKEIENEKEYIFYIRMHDYQKALEIISKLLEKEENYEKMKNLQNNKNMCLKGLYDWEELLSYNNTNNELDEEIYGAKGIYDISGEIDNKNNITRNTVNIELNEENEDLVIKNKIEREILLSKACMNLGEWKQLENHLNSIKTSFINREDSRDIYLNNEGERNNNFSGNNDINYLRISNAADESAFCINHTLSYGPNMNSSDEDYIHFNKYIENYNKKKIENENSPNIIEKKDYNNLNVNIIEENKENFFINDNFMNYKEIISEKRKLKFLENNEDVLYDLNFYSSILSIENSRYDLADKYIYEAKKTILSRIKSLLNESYVRGYELLAKNQLLFNLEQIIDYKKNHFGDKAYFKQIVNLWDKNLNIIGNDINIFENFLAIRSLVLPIEQEYNKYLDLVKICRKFNFFNKGEKVLLRLKNKLIKNNNKEIKNPIIKEIYTTIDLSYNKCLFEKGQIPESLQKSKYLVDLLDNSLSNSNKNSDNNLSELSDKIKSKIYGNYAIFKSKIFDLENNQLKEEEQNITKKTKSSPMTVCKENSENINNYFIKALKYNNISYKLWHHYAMFNYKYYKFILLNKEKNKKEIADNNKIKDKEIILATNAVNGFRNSLFIGGKNKKKTFQDILRLLDIFFSEGNKDDNLLNLIKETFNYIDIDVFLNVLPQLLSRFNIQDNKILDVLLDISAKIGLIHPHAILSALIVMKLSNSKKRKSSSIKVLDAIINKNDSLKKLIDEYEIFINELNKCSLLLHEEWSEIIEDITKIFQNGDYTTFTKQMMKMHEKMKKPPNNMYEINFYQKFNSEIEEAEQNLHLYQQFKKPEYAKSSWESYHNIYKKMIDYYKSFQLISLKYISPQLFNFKNSNIVIPSAYTNNFQSLFVVESDLGKKFKKKENLFTNINPIIYIKRMGHTLSIFNTKQHPRKMTMIGTDDKEYMFLLKGHEDLRQDERVMQLFDLVNIIFAKDNATANKKLFIDTYTIFPISHNAGLIGWVRNCDTLHQLIKDQRMKTSTIPSIEHKKIYKSYPKFETGLFLTKVEIFKEALNETEGTELKTVIWEKSKNCETWLNRRTNYSRSLAVMSIVGYILGLGDRHPSNLMMSRKNGKIIHIDFGDCFEVTMKREKFPEKVPFRLTRMLIKALEVSGIDGIFRLVCIQIMELLRKKKDSLLAILGSFIHDPIISFRLMIPMIVKKRKIIELIQKTGSKKKTIKEEKKHILEKGKYKSKIQLHKVDSEENLFELKFNNNNFETHSMKNNFENSFIKINQFLKSFEENKKKVLMNNSEKDEKKSIELKTDIFQKNEEDEEREKQEKKKMEEDERLIFNLFEENDEIESEELNKIGQMVLDRIKDKLSGTDIHPDFVYDAQTQVDKLINQATSYENLAQSYLGWCPFW